MDDVEELIGRLRDEIRAEVEPILREALAALTVSPEKLSIAAERIGELKLGGSRMPLRFYYSDDSCRFIARAAAIALGLKAE